MNIQQRYLDRREQQYMGGRYGLRGDTRERYAEAIHACESVEYLDKTVVEIARLFGHQPEAFRMMMKRHCAGVLAERDRLRRLLGYTVRAPRQGVRLATAQKYAPAIELLRQTNLTIREVATKLGLNAAALQQHILFHHRDLAEQRLQQRLKALDKPRQAGQMNCTGRRSAPRLGADEYYAEAVALYRDHPELTIREIARRLNLTEHSLGCYLRRWHRDIMWQRQELRRQQTTARAKERATHNASTTKQAKAQQKYAPALPLIEQGMSYAEAAEATGVDSEQLHSWVKHNRPDLHLMERRNNWVVLPGDVRVRRSSWQFYQQAAHDYCHTDASLRSIVRRYSLTESAFRRFLRHAFPQAVAERQQKMRKK